MHAALLQARKGAGQTHPNPAVGAVIVKDGEILARGWHRGAGLPHAEIEALRSLKTPADGSTLYVTLEPCSTHGRTPPCTEAIRQARIRRVVYGATDPNPAHAGRAKSILSQEGIAVTTGILGSECSALNAHWNTWIATGFPYVIAKAALTLDGRIASHPESRWISNNSSRHDAMKLRSSVQAILVGGETVRIDDPQLTVRDIPAPEQPWRVVWTKSGRLPEKARIFSDAFQDRTLIMKGRSLKATLRDLGKRGIASVLIEGGGRVLGQAFDAKLVDEVRFYLAPLLSGGPVPAVGGRGVNSNVEALCLTGVHYRHLDGDVCLEAKISRN